MGESSWLSRVLLVVAVGMGTACEEEITREGGSGGTPSTGDGDGDAVDFGDPSDPNRDAEPLPSPYDDAALCEGLTFDEGQQDDGSCEPTGWWAVKATVDAWWDEAPGDTAFDNRGNYTTWLLQRVHDAEDDGTVSITTRVCKEIQPPDLSDLLCKAFSTRVPERTWDKIPEFESVGAFSCLERDKGCKLTTSLQTVLTGIELDEPNGTWPPTAPEASCEAGTGESCFLDVDDDGYPGLSATFIHEGTYDEHSPCTSGDPFEFYYAPPDAALQALFGTPVKWVHAGLRTRIGVEAREIGASCGCGVSLGKAVFKNSRVIGCLVGDEPGAGVTEDDLVECEGDDAPTTCRACTPAEVKFVDDRANRHLYYDDERQGVYLPSRGETPSEEIDLDSYAPSPGPVFRALRLGDLDSEFDCADVLDATFPEPDISLEQD